MRLSTGRAPAFEINGLKREELIAAGSVILHEIYFDSLGGHGDNPPTGLAEPPVIPCNWLNTIGNSLGACSVSSNNQSKPAPAMTSMETLLHRLLQRPICGWPSRNAFLKGFTGSCRMRGTGM